MSTFNVGAASCTLLAVVSSCTSLLHLFPAAFSLRPWDSVKMCGCGLALSAEDAFLFLYMWSVTASCRPEREVDAVPVIEDLVDL